LYLGILKASIDEHSRDIVHAGRVVNDVLQHRRILAAGKADVYLPFPMVRPLLNASLRHQDFGFKRQALELL
jgi:hypothetical protein